MRHKIDFAAKQPNQMMKIVKPIFGVPLKYCKKQPDVSRISPSSVLVDVSKSVSL